eukprot:6180547-Pleurochrysis_carterae.AAC.3
MIASVSHVPLLQSARNVPLSAQFQRLRALCRVEADVNRVTRPHFDEIWLSCVNYAQKQDVAVKH